MPFIKVSEENYAPLNLYFEDHGSGEAVILIHGWPLSGASWEKQMMALLEAGYRVITYDRRGFGLSSRASFGYDYDTFARDLNHIITRLNLENVHLVGFSMGSGEVARYLGKYGSERVKSATMIGVIPPYLLKTSENPDGVDPIVFEKIKKSLMNDRPAFLTEFLSDFYNFDVYKDKLISEEVLQMSWNIAVMASPIGTLRCVDTWTTDFRDDISKIDIPTMIIHGDQDRILPIKAAGEALSQKMPEAKFVKIAGAPHGLLWTHGEQVNDELVKFLGSVSSNQQKVRMPRRPEVSESQTLQ